MRIASWSVASVTALVGSVVVVGAGACSASESRDSRVSGGAAGQSGSGGAAAVGGIGGAGILGAGGSGAVGIGGGTTDAGPDAGCGTARASAWWRGRRRSI